MLYLSFLKPLLKQLTVIAGGTMEIVEGGNWKSVEGARCFYGIEKKNIIM